MITTQDSGKFLTLSEDRVKDGAYRELGTSPFQMLLWLIARRFISYESESFEHVGRWVKLGLVVARFNYAEYAEAFDVHVKTGARHLDVLVTLGHAVVLQEGGRSGNEKVRPFVVAIGLWHRDDQGGRRGVYDNWLAHLADQGEARAAKGLATVATLYERAVSNAEHALKRNEALQASAQRRRDRLAQAQASEENREEPGRTGTDSEARWTEMSDGEREAHRTKMSDRHRTEMSDGHRTKMSDCTHTAFTQTALTHLPPEVPQGGQTGSALADRLRAFLPGHLISNPPAPAPEVPAEEPAEPAAAPDVAPEPPAAQPQVPAAPPEPARKRRERPSGDKGTPAAPQAPSAPAQEDKAPDSLRPWKDALACAVFGSVASTPKSKWAHIQRCAKDLAEAQVPPTLIGEVKAEMMRDRYNRTRINLPAVTDQVLQANARRIEQGNQPAFQNTVRPGDDEIVGYA